MKLFLVSFTMLGLLTLDKCTPGTVFEPSPGDLKGEWLINEGRDRELGKNVPILAELRLRNASGRRLLLAENLQPVVNSVSPKVIQWKPVTERPVRLEPGQSITLTWQNAEALDPGEYELAGLDPAPLEAPVAAFTVTPENALPALRGYYDNLASRLRGDNDTVIAQLRKLAAEPEAPPSLFLQLAQALESRGMKDEARAHYRAFAEKSFGPDEAPAWVRAKLESEATRQPDNKATSGGE